MATIEYIKKRIEGKEKEIAKLEKKLERIRKAEASGWINNPYYYNEHDKKYTTRDLDNARVALEKLNADLAVAIEKTNSRNVKAIIDFLEMWKEHMRKFYADMFPRYLEARAEFYEQEKEFRDWYKYSRKEREERRKKWDAIERKFNATWGFMERYVYIDKFDADKLEKDLKEEADRKYDNIIERTNDITGTITDATGLRVGDKGELDGYVIGEKGTAHVYTIGAGGYNIQCFHFRVLVHKVNK